MTDGTTRSFRQSMMTAFSKICSLTVTETRLRITRLTENFAKKEFQALWL